MLVYRVCSNIELDKILSQKSFNGVGSMHENNLNNNHDYIPNTFYMHFFPKKEDIFHLNNVLKRFICTYEIPDDLLVFYEGMGLYDDFTCHKEAYIVEFAVPSELISMSFLRCVEALPFDYNYLDFLKNGGYGSTILYDGTKEPNLKKS